MEYFELARELLREELEKEKPQDGKRGTAKKDTVRPRVRLARILCYLHFRETDKTIDKKTAAKLNDVAPNTAGDDLKLLVECGVLLAPPESPSNGSLQPNVWRLKAKESVSCESA